MTTLSDEQLFLLIKQGSSPAFDEIYNRYWYTLFNSAYKRLRDKEICSDVVQDIFTDLWAGKCRELLMQDLNSAVLI
jgi:RNA polymerase sigma-70 factor (ECF subfamily)